MSHIVEGEKTNNNNNDDDDNDNCKFIIIKPTRPNVVGKSPERNRPNTVDNGGRRLTDSCDYIMFSF